MVLRRCTVFLSMVALLLTMTQTAANANDGSPFGSFDQADPAPGGVYLQGWAMDPDTPDAIDVHVYVDGHFTQSARASVGYPGVGGHGFLFTVPVDPGFHDVCTYAISVGAGDSTLLGCKTVNRGADPFGDLNSVDVLDSGPNVRGWALEPDTPDPIEVQVYVDGTFAGAGLADQSRADVSQRYPLWTEGGAQHGFEVPISLTAGPHTVCAYGIDVGPGTNSLLGCRDVNEAVEPFGALDIAASNTLRDLVLVHGWAIDPDTGGPIDVHLYADAQPVGVMTADRYRPDVGALLGTGDSHGYAGEVSVPNGASTLCAYGINAAGTSGTNQLLGCLPIDWSGSPIGGVAGSSDVYGCGVGEHGVRLWAIDPDTFHSLTVDVYHRQPDGSEQIFARATAAEGADATWRPQFPYYDNNHFAHLCSPGGLDYFAINLGTTPGDNTLIGSD